MNQEFVTVEVQCCGGLHLHSVVAEPELRQGKTAGRVQAVYTVEHSVMVRLCSELQYGAAKQIEVDRHLCSAGDICIGHQDKLLSLKLSRFGPKACTI